MGVVLSETAEELWRFLYPLIQNPYGVAAVLANLYAESGLKPTNLQNSYERSLEMTDQQYTEAVDNGTYKDFASDGAGYGLAQWTYRTRKQNMLAAAKATYMSIGELEFQAYFLSMELQNYSVVLNILKEAASVQEASDAFVSMYEKPANLTDEKKARRASFAQEYYDAYHTIGSEYDFVGEPYRVLKRGSSGTDVEQLQKGLIKAGYDVGPDGADGVYGRHTQEAVLAFQRKLGLVDDGIAGALTQDLLLMLVLEQPETEDECVEEEETEEEAPTYTIMIEHLTEDEAEELFTRFEDRPVILEAE